MMISISALKKSLRVKEIGFAEEIGKIEDAVIEFYGEE